MLVWPLCGRYLKIFVHIDFVWALMAQLDDERESAKDAEFAREFEDAFDDLDEQFLREYRLKRLEELRKTYEAE